MSELRIIDASSRGLRGESFAAIARRTNTFDAIPGDSDTDVLMKMFDDLSANVQGVNNFRATFAEAIADFAVDEYFTTAETGELRMYKRTSTSPFYTDQGDDAAPVTKSQFDLAVGVRVNPISFGAVPDDETKGAVNVDAIQAAIDAAHALGGGIVEITGNFAVGTSWTSFGTFTFQDGIATMPFKRGLLRMRSGVTIMGAGGSKGVGAPRIYIAGGHTDPGGIFFSAFWESDGQVDGFSIIGVELDGNYENQAFTQYVAAPDDTGLWIHGHGIYCGSVTNLLVYKCKVHGFWGHGVFGFAYTGRQTDHFMLVDNDIYDNLQGGMQGGLSYFHSERNYYHGDFGWTGVGFNIEVASADEPGRYIRSINDTIDARDGTSTPLATIRDWGGYTGVDTDSPEAASYRRARRRGIMLSGDYYESSSNGSWPNYRRVNVQISGLIAYEASVCVAGFEAPQISDCYLSEVYTADIDRFWPPVNNLLTLAPGGADEYYEQASVQNVMIRSDGINPAVFMRKFRQISADIQIIGCRVAPWRLESCGGVFRVQARDFGTAQTTGTTDTGTTSSAMVFFGNSGPIKIDAQVLESRSGGARQIQYGIYSNTGTDFMFEVNGTITGALVDLVHDVNNTVFGMVINGTTRERVFLDMPIFNKGLESHDTVTVETPGSDSALVLKTTGGNPALIDYYSDGVFHGQTAMTSDGTYQYYNAVAGVVQLQLLPSGVTSFTSNWQKPLKFDIGGGPAMYQWYSSAGTLYVKSSLPASETDGTVVGTQT